MSSIELSIAIPVFNGDKTIEETIESVASQILPGVEIVVSDNASTDSTLEIVKGLMRKYPFIKYFKNEENIGFDRNANLAVERSSGEFVWFLGDDDLLAVGGLQRIINLITERPDLGAIFVNYCLCDRKTGQITKEKYSPINDDVLCEDGSQFLSAVTIFPNFMSSIVVNRSCWIGADPLKYEGSFWIQYGALLTIVSKEKSYCVAIPYVINKARISNEANEANNGGIALKILFNLLDIVNEFSDEEFTKDSKKLAYEEVCRLLVRKIISAKRNGLKVNLEFLKQFYSNFGGSLNFWGLYLPLLLLPNNVHRNLWKVYRIKKIYSFFSKFR